MATVSLRNICKSFDGGKTLAVDDVNFSVQDGEFVVLLGPSGCGKSTTLRMIAGLEAITSGRLTIDGQAMNAVPAKNRDIAMVFQSYALYPHMNVRKNLGFGLRRRKVSRAETDRRVNEVARIVGLSDLLDRRPHALSGGQRQRVALGRAIVREPKVFLFDEPLSNLDASLRASTRGEIMKQHQRLGATMIYVTHDQVEAMTMGTRICIMQAGKLVQIGPPLEVYANPINTFVAGFLGNPPMNLFDATLVSEQNEIKVRLGDQSIPVPAHSQKELAGFAGPDVVFGIRPEDVYCRQDDLKRPSLKVAGQVTGSEMLGAETIISVKIPGWQAGLTARLARGYSFASGQTIDVFLDLGTMHLFDHKSGNALTSTEIPEINT